MDYYFEILQAHGYMVEYWDLSRVFFPKINYLREYNPIYNRELSSFDEVQSLIDRMEEDRSYESFYIPQMTRAWQIRKLLRALTRRHCTMGFFDRGAQPYSSHKRSLWDKVKRAVNSRTMINLVSRNIEKLFLKLSLRCGLIKEYDYIFAAGKMAVERWKNCSGTRVVSINSIDYDRCLLKLEQMSKSVRSNYAVFLDEFLPFHPDFALLNLETVGAELYFDLLNSFFKKIELELDLKVVIAAHPKSIYSNGNPFQGREIIANATHDLVNSADLVLAHVSTAIGFAIVYRKPILLLTYEELKIKVPHIATHIDCLSVELGCPVIDLEFPSANLQHNPNEDKYADFVKNYLSNLTVPENNGAILVNFFDSLTII